MPTALIQKNIMVAMAVTVVMSSPSPIGFLATVASTVDPSSSIVFYCFSANHAYSFIVYFSKAYDVVLVVDLVFHWLVFYF